jgi:hypothetical protein
MDAADVGIVEPQVVHGVDVAGFKRLVERLLALVD